MERHTIPTHPLLQLLNLGQSGVLPTCAEEVTEGGELHTAVAALVEEGEGFFIVGGGL